MECGVGSAAEVVVSDVVLIEISDVGVDIVMDLLREEATNAEVKEVEELG